jgi:hypothetical protein
LVVAVAVIKVVSVLRVVVVVALRALHQRPVLVQQIKDLRAVIHN